MATWCSKDARAARDYRGSIRSARARSSRIQGYSSDSGLGARWNLSPIDGSPAPPPPGGCEPGSRYRGRGELPRRPRRTSPAIEPWPRAARIDARCGTKVLSEIEQHVSQRVPDLPRTRARRPHRQPPQPPVERPRSIGLDDQVNMVLLYRVVNDAQRKPVRPFQRADEDRKHALRPERHQSLPGTQRHVNGMTRVVLRSRHMRRRRSLQHARSARALALPSPSGRHRKIQLFVRPSPHLESAMISSARSPTMLPGTDVRRRRFIADSSECGHPAPDPHARRFVADGHRRFE